MDLPKIEGTQVRGKIYHLNLRIKPEIQDLYAGKSHLRGSLRTSDPKVARREVRRRKIELQEREQEHARQAEVDDLVAQLSPAQRDAYDAAGGLEGLLEGLERKRTDAPASAAPRAPEARSFNDDAPIPADDPVADRFAPAPPPVPDVELDPELDPVLEQVLNPAQGFGAESIAEPYDEDWPLSGGGALTVVSDGLDDLEDEMFTLADLFEEYVPNLEPEAAEDLRHIVRLFTEFHGDIAYDELAIGHLDEFAAAVHGLPADMMAKLADGTFVRDLPFAELVAWTVHTEAKPISETARFQYVAMLKELMFAGVPRYRRGDPWSDYRLQIVRRESVEAPVGNPTRRFSPSTWTLSGAMTRLLELGIVLFVVALLYLLWQART